MIGETLGPYEILEPLGAGGMGEVYLAQDTRLGRKVAVKVLPAEFAADPERLARFEQEARAAAALAVLTLGALSTLIGGWWFRRARPVDGWEAAGARKLPWRRAVPTGIAVGFAALLVKLIVGIPTVMIAMNILGLDRSDLEQTDFQALAQFAGFFAWLVVALVVVLGPFAEELFFRGHLFRWSASRCGTRYAYVLSATFFALVHLDLALIPMHLAVGLVFCWSYDRWRTLSVPITAHATVNALAILPLVLG